jgi:mono/diheme cytochrome c family protein
MMSTRSRYWGGRSSDARLIIGRLPMFRLSPTGQRRVVGLSFFGVTAVVVYWSFFTDGMPILWGPSASASEIAEGRELFEHEWTPNDPLSHGDGLGPVFNAKSCATCHFQGGLGGGGGLEHNAMSFEVFPRRDDPRLINGTVHNFSTDPALKETEGKLRQLFPTVKGRTIPASPSSCSGPTVIPDFDPVSTQSVQTTALFGAGWVDMISDRAILRNERNRGIQIATNELKFQFDNVPVGRVRFVKGGVGKFGWKAQFATLEEFVAAACANELGLGTPYTEQAKPIGGANSSSAPDLDKKQFRALVGFVKTLPKPVEVTGDPAAEHGKKVFHSVGCATCHVPDIGGVKGIYTDFLLYTLEDPPPPGGGTGYGEGPSPLLGLPSRPEDEPKPNEWKTPALWGVADSAPYLHDGSAPTLHDAVLKHGGDARSVREKYKALNAEDRAALLLFLGTLKAPSDALPLRDPSITKLSRK